MSATESKISPQSEAWHLDKRVPIAIILMMLGQVFLAGMIYADMKASLADHERRIRINEETDARREVELKGVGARLATLEENSRSTIRILERIETRMDNLLRSTPPSRP